MLSKQFIERVILLIISSCLMYYVTIMLIEKTNGLDLDISKTEINELQSKLNKNIELNKYEKSLLSSIVYPNDITTSLSDIGGHEDIKKRLHKTLFTPFSSKLSNVTDPLFSPPNGIILFGEPGTGKTLFAKAIAKELKGMFISCSPSVFENKLYGESSKLIKALYSLASKLKPAVIFIDEIDGILGKRNDYDQSLVNETKTIFLSEMDGITSKNRNIVLIGATNKIGSIDKAVLRRMRLHINVPLPDIEARYSILNLYLKKYDIDLTDIVQKTDGFSGSDLFELCKLAGLECISNNKDIISLADLEIALSQLVHSTS